MIIYKKPILLLGRRGHVLSDTLRILFLPNLLFDQGLLIRRLDANIKYLIIDLFLRKKPLIGLFVTALNIIGLDV